MMRAYITFFFISYAYKTLIVTCIAFVDSYAYVDFLFFSFFFFLFFMLYTCVHHRNYFSFLFFFFSFSNTPSKLLILIIFKLYFHVMISSFYIMIFVSFPLMISMIIRKRIFLLRKEVRCWFYK